MSVLLLGLVVFIEAAITTRLRLCSKLTVKKYVPPGYRTGMLTVSGLTAFGAIRYRYCTLRGLPILARLLATSIDELLMGKEGKMAGGKRGPTPKLQQQIERVSLLPRAKQKFVMEMIDTVIQQAG